MQEATELSVVVPVYDEGPEVVAGLEEIAGALGDLGLDHELIIVDDGSSAASRQLLSEFFDAAEQRRDERSRRRRVILLRLSRNFGKEAAICAGLDASRGAAVVVMDADLQHPPRLIGEMVKLWRDGCDVVEAVKSRRSRESIVARVGSWLFYRAHGVLTGVSLAGASDYKLLSRRVIDEWRRLEERETFFRGLVSWLGFRHAQLAFAVPPRRGGRSRWSLFKRTRLALHAIASFSSLPLQFITFAGLLLLVVSTGLAVQALLQKWRGEAVEGFTTVIVLNGLIGSTIMISLGIIGLYIARIYNEIKRRPRYVVVERRGATSATEG